MGLVLHIEALVATFDLEVVRLLRDAIRTTQAAGALEGRKLQPAAIYEPRRHVRPDPVVERPLHLQAGPVLERSQPSRLNNTSTPAHPCDARMPEATMTATPSPIQPPWKTVVWENKPAAAPVKITIVRPDILVSKGSVLDLFI